MGPNWENYCLNWLLIFLHPNLINIEYGSEIWYKVKTHDKHKKFHLSYMSTLGLRSQTTTDAVMSDTGHFPLQIRKNVNVIMYWLRLAKLGNEDLVRNAFNTLVKLHNFGQRNWIFLQQLQWMKKKIITSIKDSIFKTHRKNCMARKDSSESKLRTFQKFKTEYCMETYLLDL